MAKLVWQTYSMKMLQSLSKKKARLEALKPFSAEAIQQLNTWLCTELTYTSNALEGNTLTRQETALVIEKNQAAGNKALNDYTEAKNHAQAWQWVQNTVQHKAFTLTEAHIMKLHKLIVAGLDSHTAGQWRRIGVRVAGSRSVFPNPVKVPAHMQELIQFLQRSMALTQQALQQHTSQQRDHGQHASQHKSKQLATESGHNKLLPDVLESSTRLHDQLIHDVPEQLQAGELPVCAAYHPALLAAWAHYYCVSIHPFTDGNGRVARLLMNMILLAFDYLPAIVDPTQRLEYLTSLEEAQCAGSQYKFLQLMHTCIEQALDLYIQHMSQSLT